MKKTLFAFLLAFQITNTANFQPIGNAQNANSGFITPPPYQQPTTPPKRQTFDRATAAIEALQARPIPYRDASDQLFFDNHHRLWQKKALNFITYGLETGQLRQLSREEYKTIHYCLALQLQQDELNSQAPVDSQGYINQNFTVLAHHLIENEKAFLREKFIPFYDISVRNY